jgi:hypothetical protein
MIVSRSGAINQPKASDIRRRASIARSPLPDHACDLRATPLEFAAQ